MPLPRPAVSVPLCLVAALAVGGCGGDEPVAELEAATDELVEASRERYEASEEFAEKTREARQAAAEAEQTLADVAPRIEAESAERLSEASAGVQNAQAALGWQVDDLFSEVDAAIAERRYPQANAALETLRTLAGGHAGSGIHLEDRIEAVEKALAEAQRYDESLLSARSAIDAAGRSPQEDGGESPQLGAPPAEASAPFEK